MHETLRGFVFLFNERRYNQNFNNCNTMETNSKKNLKKDAVDITKIYEIIRDKGFIQDLWLDVLSDLREKPSYVRLKKMVEQVVETSVKNYATKPKDHEEKLKTRTTFTDLGIMTYTIDTLISDVLKKKLKDELLSMISKVIIDSEHRTKLKTTDKTEAVIMLEDIGKLVCCTGKDNDHEELHGSDDTSGPSKRRLPEKIVSSQSPAKKGNRKKSLDKETSLMKHSSLNMSCSNIISSGLRSPSKRLNSKNKSNASTNNEGSDVDVTKVSDDEDNCSIRSISSVHTSDLSSFEDDISISSEDETGAKVKKRVSLKLAKELYTSGRLSDIHKIHQNTEKQMSPSSSEKHSVDSLTQRSSARMRKPNSKYTSDDLICPLKMNFTDSSISDKGIEEEAPLTNGSEMEQSSSLNLAIKRERNSDIDRNSVQDSENSDSSEISLPPLPNLFEDKNRTTVKRGRPKKNKSLAEQASPCMEQKRKETKAKRGRPSKGKDEELVAKKKLCVLDDMLPNLEKKLHLQTVSTQQNAQATSQLANKSNGAVIKRKRGRPSNNNSQKELADEPIQHSVESFSKFEERLCLKDKVNGSSSPSKSSKSYETSDLYKPRSDFRIFNSSRESRAFTLFSN